MAASHSRAVLSLPPVRIVLPSGLKATDVTASPWEKTSLARRSGAARPTGWPARRAGRPRLPPRSPSAATRRSRASRRRPAPSRRRPGRAGDRASPAGGSTRPGPSSRRPRSSLRAPLSFSRSPARRAIRWFARLSRRAGLPVGVEQRQTTTATSAAAATPIAPASQDLVPPAPPPEPLRRRDPPRTDRAVLHEPPQLLRQRRRRRVPRRRVPRGRLGHDRLQVARHARRRFLQALGVLVQDAVDQPVADRCLIGRFQHQQFVERQAQAVHVATGASHWPENRSGAMYRSVPTMSPGCVRSSASAGLGQAEVGDPDIAPVIQEQVRRLDIPVKDAMAVGVFERSATWMQMRPTLR